MKKYSAYIALVVFIFFCPFSACSKSGDREKGFVEKTNEEMSKSAVDYVKKPIGKAKAIKEMSKNKAENIESQGAAGE